jgi:NodT family efflux transporter outer membrane factor (OMF) lipoprotein
MRKLLLALPLLAPLVLGACAVGPNYKRPETPPPAAGAFQTTVPGTSTADPSDRWWRLYEDPVLDRLIERALAANTDLRVARANLLRAQAVVRQARSGLLPSGDVTAGANYGNDQGGGSGGNGGFQQGGGSTQWSYNGSVTANWELDLFGRIGRSIEAARGDAQAVEAARDRVALTVAAETARAYVDACALAESIAVAKESASIAERELTIQSAREKAGAGMRLDTERSATALANVRAGLPTLEGRRRASLFELAALLGATPSEVPAEAGACTKAPAPVALIPVGDGRGLLARRPDVREAERKLAAETARIGVATAELYPSITLGGSGNFFRDDQVRGGDSFSFSLGPLISWNWGALFAGRAYVEEAEASTQAALATFDGTVLTALKEVEQALSLYAAEGERNQRLKEAAGHAEAAYRLADQRYRVGAIAFLELLDAQRDLLDARAALATSNQQLGSLRVDLFKALGSGWEPIANP